MLIKISTTLCWPIERQIPSSFAEDGVNFIINQQVQKCDAWVVYQGLYRPDETICPPERLFLYTYEPPGLHDFEQGFLDQFAKIVTAQRQIKHPGVLYRHQGQPWLAGVTRDINQNLHRSNEGRLNWEDFSKMQRPEKTKELSVICSRKVHIPGHEQRLRFLDRLSSEIGNALDLFGYGHYPLVDKWEALAPYRFHLVLENSYVPDYWTEKLADAYLGYCLPLVWGCPNLTDYFPENSYVQLDTTHPEQAVAKVKDALSKGINGEMLNAILEARRRVLEEYNLFAEIRRLVQTTPVGGSRKVCLKDENLYRPGAWMRPAVRFIKDRLQPNDCRRFMGDRSSP
jgi:hypothetical protein